MILLLERMGGEVTVSRQEIMRAYQKIVEVTVKADKVSFKLAPKHKEATCRPKNPPPQQATQTSPGQ